jgi:tetratricopeptide (TPR) repeat protein
VKAGKHADVIGPLEAALAGDPKGPRSLSVHYYLGIAYAKTGKLDAAVVHLTAAVDDPDRPEARFHLASALDRSGELAKARTEYDRFATAQPQSQLAAYAMRRSATLARMPAKTAPQAAPVPKGKKKAKPAAPVAPVGDAAEPVEPAPVEPAP